jgi:hypothetical protein
MRRFIFEDKELEIKVTLDMSEERFQELKDTYKSSQIKVMAGILAKTAIEKVVKPLVYNKDETEEKT